MATEKPFPKLKAPKPVGEHYVNNKEFSQAVADYVNAARAAEKAHKTVPMITDYIGRCILKISEGLSHKPNFLRYSYRDEMVMDAVENCIKAVNNYNPDITTRTGTPNAFAYFTQICYYAFLRRISREKRQQDIKMSIIEQGNLSDFVITPDSTSGEATAYGGDSGFVETMRQRRADYAEPKPARSAKRIRNKTTVLTSLLC